MRYDYVAYDAAWKRLKEFMFIQDCEVEERPISQTQMKAILEQVISTYEITRKEGHVCQITK